MSNQPSRSFLAYRSIFFPHGSAGRGAYLSFLSQSAFFSESFAGAENAPGRSGISETTYSAASSLDKGFALTFREMFFTGPSASESPAFPLNPQQFSAHPLPDTPD